jgi:hypothetical protein
LKQHDPKRDCDVAVPTLVVISVEIPKPFSTGCGALRPCRTRTTTQPKSTMDSFDAFTETTAIARSALSRYDRQVSAGGAICSCHFH